MIVTSCAPGGSLFETAPVTSRSSGLSIARSSSDARIRLDDAGTVRVPGRAAGQPCRARFTSRRLGIHRLFRSVPSSTRRGRHEIRGALGDHRFSRQGVGGTRRRLAVSAGWSARPECGPWTLPGPPPVRVSTIRSDCGRSSSTTTPRFSRRIREVADPSGRAKAFGRARIEIQVRPDGVGSVIEMGEHLASPPMSWFSAERRRTGGGAAQPGVHPAVGTARGGPRPSARRIDRAPRLG